MVGGGTPAGAEAAAERLVAEGARALLSFGLCGGLDPALRPGALVVPTEVVECAVLGHANNLYRTDMGLSRAVAAGHEPHGLLCAAGTAVAAASDKAALHRATNAAAVDLESGAVGRVAARHGLSFAVLRAVCDPAERDLPPATLAALDQHGAIGLLRVLGSVAARPGQIPALLALARDAAAARRALIGRVGDLIRRGELLVP